MGSTPQPNGTPERKQGRGKPSPPSVFISYTHESPAHKEWVIKLARDLRANGVEAILDQWELRFGSDVTLFMERGIRDAQRVLLVCTPTYQKKAESGKGGVGYERLVVTGEMAGDLDTCKFICVLRFGDSGSSIPSFARTRMYTDFRDDSKYQECLLDLLRDIHLAPQSPRPPIGKNPFTHEQKDKAERPVLAKSASKPSPPNEKPRIGESPFAPEGIEAFNTPPENHMIRNVAFIAIAVSDKERARTFYQETLELKPARTHMDGAWVEYDLGETTIGVGCHPEWQPSRDGTTVAFEVDDIDATIAKLTERGVTFDISKTETPVCWLTQFRDPDGNKLLMHKRKE